MSECDTLPECVAVINHDGVVELKDFSEDFSFDWMWVIVSIDKYKDYYSVEKWSDIASKWVKEAKFETLEEAIMYGITLV